MLSNSMLLKILIYVHNRISIMMSKLSALATIVSSDSFGCITERALYFARFVNHSTTIKHLHKRRLLNALPVYRL